MKDIIRMLYIIQEQLTIVINKGKYDEDALDEIDGNICELIEILEEQFAKSTKEDKPIRKYKCCGCGKIHEDRDYILEQGDVLISTVGGTNGK